MRIHKLRTLTQDGLTFVELLIVVGLLSMFTVVLLSIFTATIQTQSQTEDYSANASDGRFIMARLNYDIARSSAIVAPATLGATSSSLQLTIATTYTYALSSGSLQLNQGDGNGAISLDSDGTTVSAVSFQRLGNTGGKETIRYNFTLTSTARYGGPATTQTYTSTVERR